MITVKTVNLLSLSWKIYGYGDAKDQWLGDNFLPCPGCFYLFEFL